MPEFKKLLTGDQILDRIQDGIKAAYDGLTRSIFTQTQIISTRITTGTVIVHSLGRQPKGWLIIDSNTGAYFWRSAWDSKTITMNASTGSDVTLLVF